MCIACSSCSPWSRPARCRYLHEWVAVKHRWRLSVDSQELSALRALASSCIDSTITVTLAR